MKVEPQRVAAFLRDPGAVGAVLLHGEDHGLVRERAETLVRAVVGTLDDPFRLAEVEPDALARLPEEASALSLTGGRRVLRVRDAGDGATKFVGAVLAGRGDSILVLEAAILPTKSKLRQLIEAAPNAAAIACPREEGRGLAQSIRDMLGVLHVSVETEALAWLVTQLGADRICTRSEIEKLALYAGGEGRLDLPDAMMCVGDMAGLQLDDALFAATAGDVEAADRALELALSEGTNPVGVLRAALMHLQRLQRAKAAIIEGMSVDDAARTARPPIFGRRLRAFTAGLERWTAESLAGACSGIWETEQACKKTGAPAEILCRNAIIGLARRAAARQTPAR